MREVLILEIASGFEVHGLSVMAAEREAWGSSVGQANNIWRLYSDEDVAELMERGSNRRGVDGAVAGPHEQTLRAIGRYVDTRKESGLLFIQQDDQVLVRLLRAGLAHHVMVRFARSEVDALVAEGAASRSGPRGWSVFRRR